MQILVVDDEYLQANNIKQCLLKLKLELDIEVHNNPKKALEYAVSNKVDIAFLDIEMPGMDGLELARKLRELYPNINVIMCTAYSEYAIDAINERVSGYITKPATLEDVKKEMENLRNEIDAMSDMKVSGNVSGNVLGICNKQDNTKRTKSRIQAKTLGIFTLFVDGEAIKFSRTKSKEMLAYLIAQNGSLVSKKIIGAILFEDEPYSPKVQSYISMVVRDLQKDLEAVGVKDMLNVMRGEYSVDITKFDCDLYDYWENQEAYENRICGGQRFFEQYSWSEYEN